MLERLEYYRLGGIGQQLPGQAGPPPPPPTEVAVVDTNCLMSEKELAALKALFATGPSSSRIGRVLTRNSNSAYHPGFFV